MNRYSFGMQIKPISQISGVNNNRNKQLTVNGCCDIIDISTGKRNIKIGKHLFIAPIVAVLKQLQVLRRINNDQ